MDDTRSDVLRDAADRAARYVAGVRDRAVVPSNDAVAALAALPTDLLDAPLPAAEVVRLLDEVVGPATVASTGGRYFGFVTGGTDPAALGASVLADAWDQNAALPVMSPATAALDAQAARWVGELLGLPDHAAVTFCAGASIANLTGVLVGRDELLRRAGHDPAAGLFGAPPIVAVTSAEAHSSVGKALRLAGLGTPLIVPTDGAGRLRADALDDVLAVVGDRRAVVVLQAGNVNTGHSDPFAEVIDRLDRARTWVHVDGAFGLWANAAPERRHLVAGVERADSWASDGHKWLNTPYDGGIVAVADHDALVRTMGMNAAYATGAGDGVSRELMNLGLQMSQRARGIVVWAALAHLGRSGVADLVERSCRHAARFAEQLAAAGAEVLAPVVLNQVLVAFGDEATTDAVVARVQAGGEAWMGATTWQGRRAMRISVSDAATTDTDVDRAIRAVVGVWRQVAE